MKNKNVLVTGGGGMVAQQLIRLLKEEGANVTTVDLPTSGVKADLQGDLRDRSFCKEIVKGQNQFFNEKQKFRSESQGGAAGTPTPGRSPSETSI